MGTIWLIPSPNPQPDHILRLFAELEDKAKTAEDFQKDHDEEEEGTTR